MIVFNKRFLIILVIGVVIAINPFTASADVIICGQDGEAALEALPPGEDLLLCPDVIHDFGGVYQLGDMQGSEVRSTDPDVLARTTGTLNFNGAPTLNLTFTGIEHTGSGSSHGFRFDNGTSNITIQDSIIQGFSVGAYIKKRSGSDTVWNIKIHRNLIQDNLHQGVLGGGPGYEVVDNIFLENGSNGVFDHGIYFGCGDPGDGSPCPQLISRNYISGSSRSGSGACQGTQIVAHGYQNGTIVENNIIEEPEGNAVSTCYGIQITECCGQPSRMTNVIIRNNKIINNGRVGIGVRGVTGALIENNTIYHHSGVDVGSKIGVQANPPDTSDTPTGDLRIINNIIDMSGRMNAPVRIWEGVNPPVEISGNLEYINEYSYFDLNNDGGVGMDDLALVINALGTTDENGADLNNDGGVGLDDLAMFIGAISPLLTQ